MSVARSSIEVSFCKCGAHQITSDGYCAKCKADRCRGDGFNLARKFADKYKRLPGREKPHALRKILDWVKDQTVEEL